MKKLIPVLFFFLFATSINAQKVWLSGYYEDSSLRYLYDGNYEYIPLEWNGINFNKNSYMVVYGEFLGNENGDIYFNIEKTDSKVTLYSGNYKKTNFKCPATQNEGQLFTENNTKISYASFVSLDTNGKITVTKADWGIKVCDGKTFGVYYIHEVKNNNSSQNYDQKVIDPTSGEVINEAKNIIKISGKVISKEKEPGLNVPNFTIFETNDGNTYFISNTSRSFSMGEKLTLEGYSKTTYYEAIMKTSPVFYVTKIVSAKTSNNSTSPKNTGSLLTIAEAEEALAFHNKARNDVGVAPLTWSSELSSYAQEWADHLAKNSGCKLEHRSSSGNNGKNYGENIAMRPPQNHSAKDASKAWYDEISQFTNVILNENNWYDTGHYSQMVWHNTTQLGIGSAKCANGNYIIVANYDPSGNYMGQKAY